MNNSENGTKGMWVKRVAKSKIIHEKQFHGCDNSEMLMKIEMVLVQYSMHVNDNKRSQKSSEQHSHKPKNKKQQKFYKRQVKPTYP